MLSQATARGLGWQVKAHLESPVEGAVIEPAIEAGGDKEGVQSMSVAQGG